MSHPPEQPDGYLKKGWKKAKGAFRKDKSASDLTKSPASSAAVVGQKGTVLEEEVLPKPTATAGQTNDVTEREVPPTPAVTVAQTKAVTEQEASPNQAATAGQTKEVTEQKVLPTTAEANLDLAPKTSASPATALSGTHSAPAEPPSGIPPSSGKSPDNAVVAPTEPSTGDDGESEEIKDANLILDVGSQFWTRSDRAQIWSEAVKTWETKYADKYEELQKMKEKLDNSRIKNVDKIFGLTKETPDSKATLQRVKRYLPSLGVFKGLVMTAASLDPHKVAPIVCASIFFSLEVRISRIKPDLD
jgi:hypothetical protein